MDLEERGNSQTRAGLRSYQERLLNLFLKCATSCQQGNTYHTADRQTKGTQVNSFQVCKPVVPVIHTIGQFSFPSLPEGFAMDLLTQQYHKNYTL